MSDFAFDIDEFIAHRAEGEFTFPLHASSIGRRALFKVRCRRLNIMERASIGHLPDAMQNEVWKQLRSAGRKINELVEKGQSPENIAEAMAQNDKFVSAADVFCVNGWIEPKVVLHERDEDRSRGVLWIGRFAKEDRIAYMWACGDADSDQAKHFETFRSRPDDDVPGREGGEMVPDAPVRFAGSAGDPVDLEPPVYDR